MVADTTLAMHFCADVGIMHVTTLPRRIYKVHHSFLQPTMIIRNDGIDALLALTLAYGTTAMP